MGWIQPEISPLTNQQQVYSTMETADVQRFSQTSNSGPQILSVFLFWFHQFSFSSQMQERNLFLSVHTTINRS